MSSLSPRTVAIVGLGSVAEAHLTAYARLEQIKVIGAVEPRPERRAEISARYGVASFASWKDLLAHGQPQIACILTPASTHRELTLLCAESGAHVMCEKPMAVTLEDAEAMSAACESAGVQFFYGSSYRFLPAIQHARTLITSGAIGKPRLLIEQMVGGQGAACYRPLSFVHYPEGGPGGGGYGLVDHGIHMLDIIPWLCGKRLTAVLGRGDRSGRAARPEFAVLEMEGALGMLIYDGSTWPAELPQEGSFSEARQWVDGRGWVGETGEWDPAPGTIRIYGTDGALRVLPYVNKLFVNRAGRWREATLPGGTTPMHFGRQLAQFCADLDCGQRPSISASDGIHALTALLAIYRSERSGQWVTLSNPFDR